jgi:hypothetical protein
MQRRRGVGDGLHRNAAIALTVHRCHRRRREALPGDDQARDVPSGPGTCDMTEARKQLGGSGDLP